jgi:hypothetical protein
VNKGVKGRVGYGTRGERERGGGGRGVGSLVARFPRRVSLVESYLGVGGDNQCEGLKRKPKGS